MRPTGNLETTPAKPTLLLQLGHRVEEDAMEIDNGGGEVREGSAVMNDDEDDPEMLDL